MKLDNSVRLGGYPPASPPLVPQGLKRGEFQGLLEGLTKPAGKPAALVPSELRFSRHALERMHSRGISFPKEQIAKMEAALVKAQAKGAKDTLIVSGDKALIVNAKTATVVTVMDKASMGEQIVTNIDSTIMI